MQRGAGSVWNMDKKEDKKAKQRKQKENIFLLEKIKIETRELKKEKEKLHSVIIIGRSEPINVKRLVWALVPTCGRGILSADIIKSSA